MVGVAALLVALPDATYGQDATRVPSAPGAEAVLSGEAVGDQAPPVALNGREVRVTERGTIELHVSELPLSTVLRLLSVEGRRNIIASPKVTGTVTASVYDVSFEAALDAVLVSNNAGYRRVGDFIYVYTNEELHALAAAANPPVTRVFRLSYISSADAAAYVKDFVGQDGSVSISPPPDTGLTSSAEEAGGMMNAAGDFIIVTARPDVLATVERVLKEIDVRPHQVLVEATILRAQLTDDNALGIDFTIVGGVDLELLGGASTGLTNVTLGPLPNSRFEKFNAAASTDFTGDVAPGGITIGIIKDNVGVFLRALEQVTDTSVLANPKVLALNRQKAQVIVGRRDGFLTTTVTETQAVQTVEFLETGTQLIFRPFIGRDGFVRVELHPEDSVGFVNAQGLPSEQTTEVTTNVTVRDGQTILIGGLFREVTTDARRQVPGLGSIPFVGQLFRSNSDSTSREEVIILLTIHIVKDHDAYAEASMGVLEDIERLRVGLRQGLMWHGRERLAQSYCKRAWERLAAGDVDKALWNVDLALHNNARLLEAIKLKERLTERRSWDLDGTGTRAFIQRVIGRERGYTLPPFGRPPPPEVRRAPEDEPAPTP